MPLHPGIQPIIDAIAAASRSAGTATQTVAERRTAMDAMTSATFLSVSNAGPAMADEQTHLIDVAGGQIRVRVYRPRVDTALPAYVYFHGGGFWLGNIDLYDDSCRATAAAVDCVVVAVGYRLAPEHRFPTAAEDCYAGLCWTVEHASMLGVDSSHIAVGGGSAGGNLAAVIPLMARDRGGPMLCAQVLDIPVTDLTMSSPSITSNGEGYLLTKASMEEYRAYYAPDAATRMNPYASPLLAADHSRLPPAFVTTCEYDPLRDEGEQYAAKLIAAGVPVTVQRALGHIHGSHHMVKLAPDAAVYGARVETFLRYHLHGA